MSLDPTHDPAARSWVPGADDHPDFPIQNLPLGVFSRPGEAPRGGVAIGGFVVDLPAAAPLLGAAAEAARTTAAPMLNGLLALGTPARKALRRALFALLSGERPAEADSFLVPISGATLHLPAQIGDYTDFYSGIHHALNVGRQLRPDQPLLPNYKYVPIGYHGRASSVRVSGEPVRRPNGQRKPATETVPSFGPSRNLDFELELAVWIGPGNTLGEPIPIAESADHIAGFGLLNDWSARDVQGWEYQPLGPFLAKSFLTSVSPWIVTPEALAPFRVATTRPADDPAPLPYLTDAADLARGGLDIALDVLLETLQMRVNGEPPSIVSKSNARHLYWTTAQMVAHHSSNGCNLQPGDLLGTGTISGPEPGSYGSLLELTNGGRAPLTLPNGETRRFLADGDTVILRGVARRDGYRSIGLGEVRGTVLAAV